MNEQPKAVTKGHPIFDQFCLGDMPGMNGDFITSNRMMRVMRYLRKNGSTTEGILANTSGEKPFLPDWKALINKLVEFEFITVEPTGRGAGRKMTLTENGEQFLVLKIDPPKPEEKVGPKAGEEFEKNYLELTGTPFPKE
jgi:hypothetical protein